MGHKLRGGSIASFSKSRSFSRMPRRRRFDSITDGTRDRLCPSSSDERGEPSERRRAGLVGVPRGRITVPTDRAGAACRSIWLCKWSRVVS